MSRLTTYTTYDEIRAILGVTNEELEDSTLELDMYSLALMMELLEIDEGIETLFEVKDALQTPETLDNNFLRSIRLFSAYSVARQLCASLPMFGPKQITDSKSSITRFSTDPYKETVREIKEAEEKYRKRLIEAIKALNASTVDPVSSIFILGIQPSRDPITGT